MKKALIITVSVILILVLIFSVTLISVGAYFNGQIDYETDDKLFDGSGKSSSLTFLCYDEKGNLCEFDKKYMGDKITHYKLDEISNYLKFAFISAEDRNFYKHHGIDIKRTTGAFLNYIFHFKPTFGASTITQQVVKNISGDNELTAKRKITEIMRSLHLEMTRNKDEIFELYLNIVPMSENIIGVGEASLIYFGKEPFELSLSESATIAGITNSPNKYNPYKNPENCKEKRNRVLYSMMSAGYITEEECERAKREPLKVLDNSHTVDEKHKSSWFCETATREITEDLKRKYGISKAAARLMLFDGTKVILTVNSKIQFILDNYFDNPENFPESINSGLKYAMTVIDNKNGNVIATIGNTGKNQGRMLLNYAETPITPGSVIKPLALYAPAIDKDIINWSTLMQDEPISYKEQNGEQIGYPKNSPDRYDGDITVKDALRLSKNTVAMRLCQLLGEKNVFNHLKNNYYINTLKEKYNDKSGRVFTDIAPSPLALGQLTEGITLRKLTECYSAFPRDGKFINSKTYHQVIDRQGNILLENTPAEKKIYKTTTARIMNRLLMTVVDSGTARSISLKDMVDTAGKTGTSGQSKDKLFVGYTPYITCGIWCGYADGKSEIGKLNPNHLEIWDTVMKEIHEKVYFRDFTDTTENFKTEGLILSAYCRKSGKLPTELCEANDNVEYGYFTPENLPEDFCDRCNGEDYSEKVEE